MPDRLTLTASKESPPERHFFELYLPGPAWEREPGREGRWLLKSCRSAAHWYRQQRAFFIILLAVAAAGVLFYSSIGRLGDRKKEKKKELVTAVAIFQEL